MDTLYYTLTEEELAEVCHFYVMSDKRILNRRRITYFLIPFLAIVIGLALKASIWLIGVLALLLFIPSVWLMRKLFYKLAQLQTKRTLEASDSHAMNELAVTLRGSEAQIVENKKVKKLKITNYLFLNKSVILFSADNQQLIIPLRVIGSEEKLKELIRILEASK